MAEFCRRDVYGDEWRKRNMYTWISGNKFMDRYQKKQVSLLLIIIFAVCGTVWTIYSRRNVPEILMCVGTGFLFVLISILTEGTMGMGDGWLLMALGTVLYPEEFFQHFL